MSVSARLTEVMDSRPSMIVTSDQIAQFRSAGFVSFPRLIDGGTLDTLRAAYDELIEVGARGDGSLDRRLGGLTRQIMRPECSHAAFHHNNPACTKALEVTRALTGWKDPGFYYSQLLYKPPGHPHATPWHQDVAYGAMPFVAPGTRQPRFMLTFWVALDDADEDNGCMHFYPQVHGGETLPHRVAAGDCEDEGRMLALVHDEWMDTSQVACCPIPAGGATVHDASTLHFTPANKSNRARRAYIVCIAESGFLRSLRSRSRVTTARSRAHTWARELVALVKRPFR